MSSTPLKRSVFGRWPMATNRPVTGRAVTESVLTLRSDAPSSLSLPTRPSTTVSQTTSIFGLLNARSCMIFDARKASRRWIIVTLLANLVRNVASSMAESPPPTTAISWPRKKNPSQVAQVERPWPSRRLSSSRPSINDCAPVDTMTESASYSVSRTHTLNGRDDRSTRVTFSVRNSAPNRAACSRKRPMRSGPMMPSGKPGKFSTSVVSMSCPPGWSEVEDSSPSITSGARLARAA